MGHYLVMKPEVLEMLKSFSLLSMETQVVEIPEEDVYIGMEEAQRSLIGKVFVERRTNFLGVKGAMMKIWQYKG